MSDLIKRLPRVFWLSVILGSIGIAGVLNGDIWSERALALLFVVSASHVIRDELRTLQETNNG